MQKRESMSRGEMLQPGQVQCLLLSGLLVIRVGAQASPLGAVVCGGPEQASTWSHESRTCSTSNPATQLPSLPDLDLLLVGAGFRALHFCPACSSLAWHSCLQLGLQQRSPQGISAFGMGICNLPTGPRKRTVGRFWDKFLTDRAVGKKSVSG